MKKRILIKPLVFIACLFPAIMMVYQLMNNQLGPEPVDEMLRVTGVWALRILLLTLAITPIKQRLGKNFLRHRRMLGLFVFFYGFLHLLVYLIFEQGFDVKEILNDLLRRKFIFVGMLAFLLLIPLTVTSTKSMMKRLGKHWITLHKLVYCIAGLVILHFVWLVKSDYTEPVIYSALFIVLMLLRRPQRKRFKVR